MSIDILDAPPSNHRERRANGELFARLLYAPAEGNALFHPRKVGSVLDCGYIETGSFTKLFNAGSPPPGIDRFALLLDLDTDIRDNSGHSLRSSTTRTVKFKVSLTDDLPAPGNLLPVAKHPLEITPEITRSSDDFAFLAFAGSQREVNTVKMPDRKRLKAWFVHNSPQILDQYHMSSMQVIFKTVKSAGWVGGVAHRQRSTTAGSITGHFSHFVRANVAVENTSDVDTGVINTRGPPGSTPWSADAPRDYTIVVEYYQISRIDKWLNKFGLSVVLGAGAMWKGETAQNQEGGVGNPPGVSESNAGEQSDEQDADSSEQHVGSNEQDVGSAARDDMDPDRTVLSAIMERVGHGARDDEIIVVASSQIIQEYLKAYEVEPDAESVRYDVERVPISNGMFALHVVRLHGPENVEDIPQRSASPLSLGRTLHGTTLSSEPVVVAVKIINDLGRFENSERMLLLRELNAARIVSIRHPLILPLLGVADDEQHEAIVSLYMRNGNLLEYLKDHHGCDKKRLILQVAQAVNYLHAENGLVHGNLKCENVLVSDEENALLTDFGLGSVVEKSKISTSITTDIRQTHSMRFAAPELVIGDPQSAKPQAKTRGSDVYAFGMLVLQAVTENQPWAGVNDMAVISHVCAGKHPSRPTSDNFVTTSHAWWEACMSCWSHAPEDRPSMQTILGMLKHCDLNPYRQLVGHTSDVHSVAYFPRGGRVVSGASDGSIRIWDTLRDRTSVCQLLGHDGFVYGVAVSPDGLQICSGASDRTIRRWEAESGASIGQPMTGHADEVNCVAFSPDSTRIVSCSDDKTIRLWDAMAGEDLGCPLAGHTGIVRSVAFSPDGGLIASGSSDGTVRLWDSATGAALGLLHQPGSTAYSVCFSPDSIRLVCSCDDGAIRIWNISTRQLVHEIRAHTDIVTSVAISPSGRYLASASHDKTVRIWDAQTGDAVGPPLTPQTARIRSVAFSPDGRSVVAGSKDVGPPMIQQTAAIRSVAFSPDGRSLVAGSEDGTVGIWDLFE